MPQGDTPQLSIDKLRNKLVDLTLRNKLLTLRFGRNSSIRLVDEVPGRIFTGLMNGATYTFQPLPDPTDNDLRQLQLLNTADSSTSTKSSGLPSEEDWARRNGIDPSYDLPADGNEVAPRHTDRKLQTLFYREKLETLIRRMASDARAAIDETGSNMLFLGLGFLEWIEERPQNASSELKSHLAPLILVPVRFEKAEVRAGLRSFTLQWTGEDVQENLALRLFLERDYAIKLPEFDPDRGLESYFDDVHHAVSTSPKWKIRRQAYVTLIPGLGRLLLYNDLGSQNWFAGRGIGSHPLVSRLLGVGVGGGDGLSFESRADVPPETIDNELNYPVTDRIDSSQLEALRLALAGENLVIQGPPGTGKSQTITNIIAAMLANGKKVLFVADKLAAIEVVKRRLDAMDLGHFCLELHSNRTRKKSFLEAIKERLELGTLAPPTGLEQRRQKLLTQRKLLASHIEVISREVAAERTTGDILFAAGRSRFAIGNLAERLIEEGIPNKIAAALPTDSANLRIYEDRYERLSILATAIEQMRHLGPIHEHPWREVQSPTILSEDLAEIRGDLEVYVAAHHRLSSALAGAQTLLLHESQLTEKAVRDAISTRKKAEDFKSQLAPLSAADDELRQIASAVPLPWPSGRAALVVCLNLSKLAQNAPPNTARLMHPGLHADGVTDVLSSADQVAATLKEKCNALRKALPAFSTETPELRQRCVDAASALASRNPFDRFLSPHWKAAVRLISEMGAKKRFGSSRAWARTLHEAASLLGDIAAFEGNEPIKSVGGPHFNGLATPFSELRAVAAWVASVREAATRVAGMGAFATPLLALDARSLHRLAEAGSSEVLRSAREKLIALASKDWQRGTTIVEEAIVALAPSPLRPAAIESPTMEFLDDAIAALSEVSQASFAHDDARNSLVTKLQLQPQNRYFHPDLVARSERATEQLQHLTKLVEWSSYVRERSPAVDEFTSALVDLAERGTVPAGALPDAWTFAYHRALARRIYQSEPVLHRSSGSALDAARTEFAALDAEIMKLRRKHIGASLSRQPIPPGNRGPLVKNMTERAALEHEISKQKAHRPIREIMKRAGSAVIAMKPCFMMGPLAVAQYLAPGTLEFDAVIMDEASQLRPEEALSAVARGKQLIVVGDDRQLPPTTFFERIGSLDEDEEEEEVVGEREESILRLASQSFRGRMLSWHYRSRNEALIAFSNYHFYNNQLVVFPTPNPDPAITGIEFRYVEQSSCSEGVNDKEAQLVAAAAAEHLRTNPKQSLIVVAMNIKQKERIRSHFYDLTKDDPAFAQSDDASGRDEPFDIKNLENVQGDERDVVMISMTYGPDPESGRVARRFGPINGQYGHRRLNVLFTRAREKMVVFSSMRYNDILGGENPSPGVAALRNFLLYAETKTLHANGSPVGSGREPESDFEVAVADALQKRGYDCVAQLGVAGFFLDIAVRDPNQPERYLLGVECDGASYHSSRSARDRDRLRQEVLEGLGWRIERVWSTDWFLDPDAQIRRLVVSLQSASART